MDMVMMAGVSAAGGVMFLAAAAYALYRRRKRQRLEEIRPILGIGGGLGKGQVMDDDSAAILGGEIAQNPDGNDFTENEVVPGSLRARHARRKRGQTPPRQV